MIQTIAPTITATSAGDTFFLVTAVGGADSAAVAGECGLPQCGQVGALGEISLPQSRHFTSGMRSLSLLNSLRITRRVGRWCQTARNGRKPYYPPPDCAALPRFVPALVCPISVLNNTEFRANASFSPANYRFGSIKTPKWPRSHQRVSALFVGK
jgi:hypothetical protein